MWFKNKDLFMPRITLLMLFPFLQSCFDNGGLKLLWHVPIASQIQPIVQNGTVYIDGFRAGHPGEPHRLFALDAQTGKERWVSADSLEEVYGESGGYVFLLNKAKHLVQLNAQTGEKIYESDDSNGLILNWVIRGDIMFIVNTSMEVSAVDNRLSKVLWRMKLPFKASAETNLQLLGQNLVVSGNSRDFEHQFGMVWALNAETGAEIWHFEPTTAKDDYAPLKVYAYGSYILATNTSPLALHTYVLNANTGKERYPPIGVFEIYGCQGDTAFASNGTFDLKTGQQIGNEATWVEGSFVHNGIAWRRRIGTVGTFESFILRSTYNGDFRGSRNWLDIPPNSSIEGFNLQTGKSVFQTRECKYTQFSPLTEWNGHLFHASIAEMKEGKSGVWAYRLP
jgi:hypothetical protein